MASISFSGGGHEAVTQDLVRFRQNVTNRRDAFLGMADIIADAQRDHFNTEGRHYGPAWTPLSPRYKAWKARRRPGKKILVFDGTLKAQAAPLNPQNFGFYKVNGKGLEVGVSYSRVPYAKYHHEGASWTTKGGARVNLPSRPILGQPTRQDQKDMVKVLHEHIVKGTSLARR